MSNQKNQTREKVKKIKAIGEYISSERQKQGISIRGLSKLTGVSHSEINKIESGERTTPSPYHLKAIADALGINQIECLLHQLVQLVVQEQLELLQLLVLHILVDLDLQLGYLLILVLQL